MLSSKNKQSKKQLRQHAIAALGEFRPKGLESWGMFLIGFAIASYIAFVICSKIFLLFSLREGLPAYLFFPVLAPAIYWLMSLALQYFRDKPPVNSGGKKKKKKARGQTIQRRLQKLSPVIQSSRAKLSSAVFFGAFGCVFAVLLIALFAQYPGVFFGNKDISVQWQQVQTSAFDTWHPPIHTMLIWLVTRIVNSYGFFIGVQMFFFSLMAGYMAVTLRAWGIQRFWIALFGFVAAIGSKEVMLFAFKDCMFTCFVLWAAVCLVNIVLSHGAWLDKWHNRVAFAFALAFVSTIRHNGIFFTVPIIALLLALYVNKKTLACVFSGALALALVAGIRGPLYQAAGVTNAAQDQTYIESIGLPMTVLTSIYKVAPSALDENGVRLMQYLATPEDWESRAVFGDYNSVKRQFPPSLENYNEKLREISDAFVLRCPPDQLLPMLLHAVRNEPVLAMKALGVVMQVVWDPFFFGGFPAYLQSSIDVYSDEIFTKDVIIASETNEEAKAYLEKGASHPQLVEETIHASKSGFLQTFQGAFRAVNNILLYFPLGFVLQWQCIGVHMLALALCLWFSLRRRRGWNVLLLILPSLAYNLGTMLLLCGSDYRFFHFNLVITMPLVLVCLAKQKQQLEGVPKVAKRKKEIK